MHHAAGMEIQNNSILFAWSRICVMLWLYKTCFQICSESDKVAAHIEQLPKTSTIWNATHFSCCQSSLMQTLPGRRAIPLTSQIKIASIMKEATMIFSSYAIGQYMSCAAQRATTTHTEVRVDIWTYAVVCITSILAFTLPFAV